jgi:hypothetical protein
LGAGWGGFKAFQIIRIARARRKSYQKCPQLAPTRPQHSISTELHDHGDSIFRRLSMTAFIAGTFFGIGLLYAYQAWVRLIERFLYCTWHITYDPDSKETP